MRALCKRMSAVYSGNVSHVQGNAIPVQQSATLATEFESFAAECKPCATECEPCAVQCEPCAAEWEPLCAAKGAHGCTYTLVEPVVFEASGIDLQHLLRMQQFCPSRLSALPCLTDGMRFQHFQPSGYAPAMRQLCAQTCLQSSAESRVQTPSSLHPALHRGPADRTNVRRCGIFTHENWKC